MSTISVTGTGNNVVGHVGPGTSVSMTSVDVDGKRVTRTVIGSQTGKVINIVATPEATIEHNERGINVVSTSSSSSSVHSIVCAPSAMSRTKKLAKRRLPVADDSADADKPEEPADAGKRSTSTPAVPPAKPIAGAESASSELKPAPAYHMPKHDVHMTMTTDGTKVTMIAMDGSVEVYDTAAAPIRTSYGTVKSSPRGALSIKWD